MATGIKLKMDENGQRYVDAETLNQHLGGLNQEILLLKQQLILQNHQKNAQLQRDSILKEIIGEDEDREGAAKKLADAFKMINNTIKDKLSESNKRGSVVSPAAAINMLDDDKAFQTEFEKEFPGLDFEDVVKAHNSKRVMNRLVNGLVDTSETVIPKKKPMGLGAPLNGVDLALNSSDGEVAALLEALRNEELK